MTRNWRNGLPNPKPLVLITQSQGRTWSTRWTRPKSASWRSPSPTSISPNSLIANGPRSEPQIALQAVLGFEEANSAELKRAGTGLEGGPGDALSGLTFSFYLAAMEGWVEVDPEAAWNFFKDPKGPLSKSEVVEDYRSKFHAVIFHELAKTKPDLAFEEFLTTDWGRYPDLNASAMLEGYVRSAPKGQNWEEDLGKILKRKFPRGGDLATTVRHGLMGRWLQDDSKAAETWFNKNEVAGIQYTMEKVIPDGMPACHSIPMSNSKKRKRFAIWHLPPASGPVAISTRLGNG